MEKYVAIRMRPGDPEILDDSPTASGYRAGTSDQYYWVRFDESGGRPERESGLYPTPEAAEQDALEHPENAGLRIDHEWRPVSE